MTHNTPASALPGREFAHFRACDALGGIEQLHARFENHTFARHSHEGYTIGVIEQGAQGFYRSGGNHVAPAGTIILVNADEVHSGHSETRGGWSYRAMYPSQEQLQQLTRDLNPGRHDAPYFPSAVVQDTEVAAQLYQLLTADGQHHSRLAQQSLLYDALRQLIARHSKQPPSATEPAHARRQLSVVKEFLDDYPEADVSLEELATLAGLSPYHLSRSFKKAYGLPPHAYQVQSRLRQAKKLLRAGSSIADAAIASGFHDQSHLHRNFRRSLGITPGQYRAAF